MSWLKTTWGVVVTALLAAASFWLVASGNRHKRNAEKWAKRAEHEAERQVAGHLNKAHEAIQKADRHEELARKRKEQAKEKIDGIAKKDETMAEIVSGWSSDRVS